MQKIERLLGIILALYRNKKLTAQELADLFEVNVRTIYRDIQALSELEIPIISHIGNEGGYSILDEYFIPPIIFNRDEILALLLSQKIISTVNIPGYVQYINSAFLKIRNIICSGLQEELEEIEKRILFDISYEYSDNENSTFFHLFQKSFENNLKIQMDYLDGYLLNSSNRIISPYGLIFNHGVWDVIAFCERDNQEKAFKVGRIKNAKLLNDRFSIPKDFCIIDWYNCKHYSGEHKEGNKTFIKIRMLKETYYEVKDIVYFRDGKILEDGANLIMEICTTRPDDYIWLAVKYYDGITILEPEDLRSAIIKRTKKLNEIYNNK